MLLILAFTMCVYTVHPSVSFLWFGGEGVLWLTGQDNYNWFIILPYKKDIESLKSLKFLVYDCKTTGH